jgi:hypothetical protein
MSHQRVEYAGGMNLAAVHESRRGVLARAPAWWRQLSGGRARSAPDHKCHPQPKASSTQPAPVGWVWGLAVAGLSMPCRMRPGGDVLPEQWRGEALRLVAEQANRGGGSIPLLWDHGGPQLARNVGTDLLLRVVDLHGTQALAFEARLRECPASQRALEHLEAGLVGVSVEFNYGHSYVVDRPGIGQVRIIDRANLLGIALVPRASGTKAAYAAATAAGRRGASISGSRALRDEVQHRAWHELTKQAQAAR